MVRRNNFDFLRLIFAAFVIITHSYPISGAPEYDGVAQLTGRQTSFSQIGLSGFFVISGYLIFKSLQNSGSLVIYYWKRVLRLFPGLLCVLLVTVIVGAFLTEYSILDYFADKTVWHYVPKNLSLFKPQAGLADVFETNPYPVVINGSLWTLLYEFVLYVLISILFFIRGRQYWLKGVLLLLFVVFFVGIVFFQDKLAGRHVVLGLWHFAKFGTLFLAGSLLAVFSIEKYSHLFNRLFAVLGVALLTCLWLSCFESFQYLILPLLIIPFGLSCSRYINRVGERVGDLSYGMYIYAFPLQQTLVLCFGLETYGLMFWSLLLVPILGYLSWHLVEKRALRLKTVTFDVSRLALARKIWF